MPREVLRAGGAGELTGREEEPAEADPLQEPDTDDRASDRDGSSLARHPTKC
jgi:hypothetical protein